ncbi:NfeD family protein [Dokdonella sp.]|uniref:NfeD family protein n=1 Tax=Dokdonella sp. TaxID=2291710 RepID=UPI0025C0A635|nr:NfeD family protein [Dokdonella sp.]MBX3690700.1 NfeD family protein [Dokdonella sp.]MCW5569054.1 NfeD family protein [Dokdonella sp.]
MANLLSSYGWWILALVLIGAELVVPGYFLLWVGIAAGIMGLVTLFVPDLPFIAQATAFGVLSVIACIIYWKYIRPVAEQRDDQPLLNRRGDRMLGRRVLVAETFVNGRGKVRVGDTVWLAEGPDAAVGDAVEVVGVHGATLKVTPVA